MTSGRFMEMYKILVGTNGRVHLKTDNVALFDYTLEKIKEFDVRIHHCTHDLYDSGIADDILSIKTTYEKIYLDKGMKICYLSFSFT
jgi:tRNA (guanine-N7-)-methyltransferase